MVKNAVIILATIVFLTGCTSNSGIRVKALQNLSKLSLGMNKNQIYEIMGHGTVPMYGDADIPHPYRTEVMKQDDGTTAEVLFYYTDKKKADGVITNDELTPLVLQNNQLVGWGWLYMEQNIQEYRIYLR